MDVKDFIRVRVISKSNFRDYYNIRFLDLDREDCGIYFRKNDFWSLSPPRARSPGQLQEEEQVHVQVDQVETERAEYNSHPSRQISPFMECSRSESVRSDRVYRLPVGSSVDQLSPKSRKKARMLHLPPQQEFMRANIAQTLAGRSGSSTPQARIAGFLDKVLLGRK